MSAESKVDEIFSLLAPEMLYFIRQVTHHTNNIADVRTSQDGNLKASTQEFQVRQIPYIYELISKRSDIKLQQ